MSIYGNPVMLGGSGGGGGENAYVSFDAPTSAVGENGQYWFQLSKTKPTANIDPTLSASVSNGGWEFTANNTIQIVGARAKVRSSNYEGTVKLSDSTGNVIAEQSISLVAGEWVIALFDSPVQLTSGQNYIIMLFGRSGTLGYNREGTTISDISYVRGRYGSLPGTEESGVWYCVDMLIANAVEPPYPIKTQYYKTGGVWALVNMPGVYGGDSHNYSTTEQVIGTWIDGKPIYELTVITGNRTYNVEDLSIDLLIFADGYGSDNSGYTGNKWTYTAVTNNSNRLIYLSADRKTLYLNGGYWQYGFTIQYTKTTDQARS